MCASNEQFIKVQDHLIDMAKQLRENNYAEHSRLALKWFRLNNSKLEVLNRDIRPH